MSARCDRTCSFMGCRAILIAGARLRYLVRRGDRAGEHVFTSSDWEANTGYASIRRASCVRGEGFRSAGDLTTRPTRRSRGATRRPRKCASCYGSWYVPTPARLPSRRAARAARRDHPGPNGAVRGFQSAGPRRTGRAALKFGPAARTRPNPQTCAAAVRPGQARASWLRPATGARHRC